MLVRKLIPGSLLVVVPVVAHTDVTTNTNNDANAGIQTPESAPQILRKDGNVPSFLSESPDIAVPSKRDGNPDPDTAGSVFRDLNGPAATLKFPAAGVESRYRIGQPGSKTANTSSNMMVTGDPSINRDCARGDASYANDVFEENYPLRFHACISHPEPSQRVRRCNNSADY